MAGRGGSDTCSRILGGAVAQSIRVECPCRYGPRGFRGMENRKASFKGCLWKVWILAPESRIHSICESATTKSARAPAEEHCRLTDTRFHGISSGVPHFASH